MTWREIGRLGAKESMESIISPSNKKRMPANQAVKTDLAETEGKKKHQNIGLFGMCFGNHSTQRQISNGTLFWMISWVTGVTNNGYNAESNPIGRSRHTPRIWFENEGTTHLVSICAIISWMVGQCWLNWTWHNWQKKTLLKINSRICSKLNWTLFHADINHPIHGT